MPLFAPAEASYDRIRELLGLAPAKNGRPRRPADDVWDALCAALRWTPEPGDHTGAKRMGRAVAALCAAHATPQEVKERASRYRQVMPNVYLSPEALVKHWSALAAPAKPYARLPDPEPEPEGEPVADLAAAAREAMRRLQGANDLRGESLRGG